MTNCARCKKEEIAVGIKVQIGETEHIYCPSCIFDLICISQIGKMSNGKMGICVKGE